MSQSQETERKGRVVDQSIETSATPRAVWDAWTDPADIARWFVDRAEGQPVVDSTYVWTFERFGYNIPYRVLEAEPEKRFVLGFESAERSGVLEVDIEHADGRTRVRLVNSGFKDGAEWDEEYEGIDSGWQMSLALLVHYLENYSGTERTQMLAMRPVPLDLDEATHYLRDADGLAKWLTDEGSLGGVGEACELVLKDGTRVSGTVLTHTKRESAISWTEENAVLELKAFSGPAGPMACLRGSAWGMDAERAKALEQGFEAALERLATVLSA